MRIVTLLALLLVGCAGAPGRMEPTIVPRTFANPQERITAIERTNALRNELVARFPPPLALCVRVPDGSIAIDGRLDDPAWRDAKVIEGFRHTHTGNPLKFDTRVRLAWDCANLYVAFECDDRDVIGTITRRDGDLWKEDVAELFINPTGDEASYVEFEVNPIGTVYDASIADYRPETTWDVSANDLDMDLAIRRYDATGCRAAVLIEGTPNDPADADRGWICEMAIPFDQIARGANMHAAVPRDGDVWRMGIYRINSNTSDAGKAAADLGLGAWNPTSTWFHRPWLFGRVVFIGGNAAYAHDNAGPRSDK